MSPFEHGEVFTLADGGEADLDLGNYERFLGVQLTKEHNITTGKVYRKVIGKERRGDYLGKTVQVVPHITNEIQDWIEEVAKIPVSEKDCHLPTEQRKVADVCLIEVGGTVGDIESAVFFEAAVAAAQIMRSCNPSPAVPRSSGSAAAASALAALAAGATPIAASAASTAASTTALVVGVAS